MDLDMEKKKTKELPMQNYIDDTNIFGKLAFAECVN